MTNNRCTLSSTMEAFPGTLRELEQNLESDDAIPKGETTSAHKHADLPSPNQYPLPHISQNAGTGRKARRHRPRREPSSSSKSSFNKHLVSPPKSRKPDQLTPPTRPSSAANSTTPSPPTSQPRAHAATKPATSTTPAAPFPAGDASNYGETSPTTPRLYHPPTLTPHKMKASSTTTRGSNRPSAWTTAPMSPSAPASTSTSTARSSTPAPSRSVRARSWRRM